MARIPPNGVVAGVDSSTQSCKVELRDRADGHLLGTGRAPHPRAVGPRSEQDPRAWWSALKAALTAACQAADLPASSVCAIAVAAQCHGLVALDGAGGVLRPAKLWNDTTSTRELARLRELVPAQDWARRTGSVPTAAFTIGKVAWLATHEPHHLRALATMLLPHDYLTYRLTGQHVTDRSEASGTGYFDASADSGRGAYLTDILELVDPDKDWAATLPRVLGPSEAAGTITPEAAAELGLSLDVIVGAGGGDQHSAALGLGVAPGDVVFSLGTSGVVFSSSTTAVHDATGVVDGVADMTGAYLPLVSTLNAARVTDLFAHLLGVDAAGLAELALAAPPTPGPVLAAHLDGERKPDLPDARGLLAGLTTTTTREELARAAYEGVLLGLTSGLEALSANGVDTGGRVLAVGGGARSAAYRQLLADLLQREVLLPDPVDADEAPARGACVQATAVLEGLDVRQVRDAWRPKVVAATAPRTTERDPAAAYAAVVAANSTLTITT